MGNSMMSVADSQHLPDSPLWISETDVSRLLDGRTLVDRIEQGFQPAKANRFLTAPEIKLRDQELPGYYLAFASISKDEHAFTVKVLTEVPANVARGKPLVQAIICLFNTETGSLMALIEARRLTAMRTAAVTAVAARVLSPGQRSVLTVVGTGEQARAHAALLPACLGFERILIVSASKQRARADALAADIATETGVSCEAADIIAGVASADTLVIATMSRVPVFELSWLKPEVFVATIGECLPSRSDVPFGMFASACCLVSDLPDRLRLNWKGATDRPAVTDNLHRVQSLSGIVSGNVRFATRGQTLFLSDGLAIEDVIAASIVFEAARSQNSA
jgi:ornithine cyclodeaminase/alanine dehydrogenase-like protein (mu-crystallin family)